MITIIKVPYTYDVPGIELIPIELPIIPPLPVLPPLPKLPVIPDITLYIPDPSLKFPIPDPTAEEPEAPPA